jgi:hypothetical protein
MDVEEARKILGPKYADITDAQIQGMILFFSKLSHVMIDEYTKDPKAYLNKLNNIKKSMIDKERHLANKMSPKATLDQKIKRHTAHTANCKCRPMPESIKKEIQKRIALQSK